MRTVYRWHAAQEAPRCAVMALYWLTRWGQSHVNAQAVNDAVTACGLVASLERDIKALRIELDDLRAALAE